MKQIQLNKPQKTASFNMYGILQSIEWTMRHVYQFIERKFKNVS